MSRGKPVDTRYYEELSKNPPERSTVGCFAVAGTVIGGAVGALVGWVGMHIIHPDNSDPLPRQSVVHELVIERTDYDIQAAIAGGVVVATIGGISFLAAAAQVEADDRFMVENNVNRITHEWQPPID